MPKHPIVNVQTANPSASDTSVAKYIQQGDFVFNDTTGECFVCINPGTGLYKQFTNSTLLVQSTAVTGYSAAAATAGGDVFAETQTGGTAAADADGHDGGSYTLTAGDGSAGGAHTSNNPDGGAGGILTLTPGAGGAAGSGGSGVAGAAGHIKATRPLLLPDAQVIDMADAQHVLTRVPGTPAGTEITSNVLFVDANSATTEDLLLPPEADCNGLVLWIVNTGGETIVVKDDGDATTVVTIATAEVGWVACNGTTWSGGISAAT